MESVSPPKRMTANERIAQANEKRRLKRLVPRAEATAQEEKRFQRFLKREAEEIAREVAKCQRVEVPEHYLKLTGFYSSTLNGETYKSGPKGRRATSDS
jgi:hypothetical protein